MQLFAAILKDTDTVLSALAHLAVLVGAIAAFIKFRMLERPRRYKSELATCRHHQLPDRVVFEAEYVVYNNGDRPIDFTAATVSLYPAIVTPLSILKADKTALAEHRHEPKDRPPYHIKATERILFSLYCELTSLPPVVFVVCQLEWPYKDRIPDPFRHMYVSAAASKTGDLQPPAGA